MGEAAETYIIKIETEITDGTARKEDGNTFCSEETKLTLVEQQSIYPTAVVSAVYLGNSDTEYLGKLRGNDPNSDVKVESESADSLDEPPCPTCGQIWPDSLSRELQKCGTNNREADSGEGSTGERGTSEENLTKTSSFRFRGCFTHRQGENAIFTNGELSVSYGETYSVVGGYHSPSGFVIVLKKIKTGIKASVDSGKGTKGDGNRRLRKPRRQGNVDSPKAKKDDGKTRLKTTRKGISGESPLLEEVDSPPESSQIDSRDGEQMNEIATTSKSQTNTPSRLKLKCRYCKKTFLKIDSLRKHEHFTHDISNELICELCNKVSFSKKSLRIHLASKHKLTEAKPIKCNHCYKSFMLKSTYDDHMKIHSEKLVCKICGKKFNRPFGLKCHMASHTGVWPYACEICKKGFAYSNNCRKHVLEVHAGKRFPCEMCSQTFAQKSAKMSHIKVVHLGLKPFICDLCQKCFAKNANLLAHRAKHFSARPFLCETCGRNYATKADLGVHMRLNHSTQSTQGKTMKSEKCVCSECGKVLSSKQSLKLHSTIHSDLKPFTCKVCNKSFKRKLVLKLHMNIHDAVKPYSCSSCNATFAFPNNLKRHLVVHSGEQAFQCGTCSKKFSHKSSLMIHLKTHSGVKRYCCSVCQLRFSENRALKNHWVRTHL